MSDSDKRREGLRSGAGPGAPVKPRTPPWPWGRRYRDAERRKIKEGLARYDAAYQAARQQGEEFLRRLVDRLDDGQLVRDRLSVAEVQAIFDDVVGRDGGAAGDTLQLRDNVAALNLHVADPDHALHQLTVYVLRMRRRQRASSTGKNP